MAQAAVLTDISGFLAASEKLESDLLGKLEAIAMEEGREIIRESIEITPPGARGRSPEAARKRGESAIAGDVFKVVVPVKPEKAERHDVAAIIRSRRDARGRTKKTNRRIAVPGAAAIAYTRKAQRGVGKAQGGWAQGASFFGVTMPAHVSRNRGPGSVRFEVTRNGVEWEVKNGVDHAQRMQGLDAALRSLMARREAALQEKVERAIAEAARAAGFQV